MKIWKQFAVSLVLLAAAGGGYHVYESYLPQAGAEGNRRGGRGGDVPVIVMPANIRRIEERVEAVGTTRASQSVDIVSTASGRVVELNFESGQRVAKDDVLLALDDDIERADLDESEANLQEMQQALERARSLRRNNTVSQAQIDQLTAKHIAAQAARDRAARRLADRTVRAPFAGVTGLRRVDIGARIDDDTVVTTLDDLSQVEVEFQLPEIFYGNVRRSLEIAAVSAAFPARTFTAKIANVDSRIDETTRAFLVRAVMPNPDLLLPAGMFMTISVVLDSHDAIMVPEAAVIFEGSQTYVFVVEDNKAVRRQVQLGQRRRDLAEVTSGLTGGDLVVQRGTQNLRNGSPVAILENDAIPAPGDSADGGNTERGS
jgi:membrane fusion protein (multidrug efflux system)